MTWIKNRNMQISVNIILTTPRSLPHLSYSSSSLSFDCFPFLDVTTHLYKRLCPPVGPLVAPSICPCYFWTRSVRPSADPLYTRWMIEKRSFQAEIWQNSIKKEKLCHLRSKWWWYEWRWKSRTWFTYVELLFRTTCCLVIRCPTSSEVSEWASEWANEQTYELLICCHRNWGRVKRRLEWLNQTPMNLFSFFV